MKSFDPARWANIKLFAMDVDGVLTDGTVTIFSNGEESKTFSILDGLGLRRLISQGVEVAWISGRFSKATAVRAAELEIPHLYQGTNQKREVLSQLAADLKIQPEEVCYMGDDVVDVQALEWAGIAVSVPNAFPAIRDCADFVTARPGGSGAVREICNLILDYRNT